VLAGAAAQEVLLAVETADGRACYLQVRFQAHRRGGPAPPPYKARYRRAMIADGSMHIAAVDQGMLGANGIGTLAMAVGQIAAVSTGYGPVMSAS
jgi:hypothetical protein